MKRILCSLAAFLLLLGIGDARAQQQTTVSIPEVVAEAGTTVSVPINVTDFTNVGAITLAIDYSESALTFEGAANFAGESGLNASASGGVVRLSWASLEALDIGSGRLVDLVFTFNGGSSQLEFLAESEIADAEANPIDATFEGGAVFAEAVQVMLGSAEDVESGATVQIPIVASEPIDNFGSLSLVINYDAAALDAADPLVAESSDAFEQFVAGSPQDGQVNVGGYSTAGVALGDTIAVLQFVSEGTSTSLRFGGSSEITDVNDAAVSVIFSGGRVVAAGEEVGVMSIPDTAVAIGSTLDLPVQVENLANVGSASLEITFDTRVLSFQEVTGFDAFGGNSVVSNPSPGVIRLAGFSTAGVDLAGTLATLQFVYNGGTTQVAFDEVVSEITNPADEELTVFFEGGIVSELQPQAEIAFVDQVSGGQVVTVESVTLSDGGFVAIHDSTLLEGEALGSVIGVSSYLEVGTHENVQIVLFDVPGLDTSAVQLGMDQTLIAMPHLDSNGNQTYDFLTSEAAEDGPYVSGGSPVVAQARVTVEHSTVTFEDQTAASGGMQVTITSVYVPDAGFVAMHDSTLLDGVALGSVVGVSDYLEAGTHEDVVVTLFDVPGLDTSATALTVDQTLIAMPHLDTNGNQTYDFLTSSGSADGPYLTAEGGPVVDDAFVQVVQELSIAEARRAELGSIVSVDGIVTRAMGRFIWMQDVTAGIVLFSSGGDFPVAGEVEGGDFIRVQGELDEFNELIQIRPDTIVVLDDDAGIPAPQQVTAGELLEDCESYQSELVQIDRLRFTEVAANYEPITFDANSSYFVFDAVTDTITVRVQRDTDSELVGYTLDENTFDFRGVVGQFRDDCQLMPVLTSDVFNVRATANEGSPELPTEFALHGNFPNPFNPSTTISFDLPAPADVTITLYDVMGREVMAVSKGTMAPGAEQSVKFDAAGLGSGVYLYRVVAVSGDETHASTGKMVLVK